MTPSKKILNLTLSFATLGAMGLGLYQAHSSKQFYLEDIQISHSIERPPLDQKTVLKLVDQTPGKQSLFEIDLRAIEQRVLANDWVQEVRLIKKLPHTLSVELIYRRPRALLQQPKGKLSYVDASGKIFGPVQIEEDHDLPILSNFNKQPDLKIREALRLIANWEASPLNQISNISSVIWDQEKGFRVLAIYSLKNNEIRTMVDLGYEIDANLDGKLSKLNTVFQYLNENSIAVRQVWADLDKKVVVKQVRGAAVSGG